MDRPEPNDLLPLTPQTLNVLLTLGDRTLHGYAIMQDLERRTQGREKLLPGSLYATIARMVKEGIIEEIQGHDTGTGRRRREYRATSFGRSVARAEVSRLQGVIDFAREQGLAAEAT